MTLTSFFSKANFYIFILLCLAVTTFSFQYAFAGNIVERTRGTSATLNWSVSGASSCQHTFSGEYPSAADGLRDYWTNSTGASGSWTGNVLAAPGTYTFVCTEQVYGASDSATLTITDCPSGTSWNSSTNSCATTTPTPVSGDIKANSLDSGATCTIPSGGSNCTGTISWTTMNASSASVWYTNDGVNPGSGTTGSFTVNWMRYGANNFKLCNGTANCSTSLDTVTLTGQCASGTTWNGSTCAASSPSSPTATITVTNCYIAAGASTCTGTVSWTSSNLTATPSVRQNDVQFSTAGTNTGTSRTLQYGNPPANNFTFIHNGTTLATNMGTGLCATGTTWNTTTLRCETTTAPPLCTDPDAVNFNGPAPCEYAGTINVAAVSPVSTLPSSTTTFQFTPIENGGNGYPSCRPVDSNQQNIPGYRYVTYEANYPRTVTLSGADIPSAEGEYTYYIKCRHSYYPEVIDYDNIKLHVCPEGKVWSTRSRMCVIPSDLTAGAVWPTTVAPNVATNFYSTISNIGTGTTEQQFDTLWQYASVTNPEIDPNSTVRDSNNHNTPILAGGASATSTHNMTLWEEVWFLRACADKRNANDDGKISESNENNNCGPWTQITVSGACPLPWGGTLQNGQSVDAYNTPSVVEPDTCETHRQRRTCNNGVLSDPSGTGSYVYGTCSSTPPAPPVTFLNITPRTVPRGGLVKMNWSIANPTSQCRITAAVHRPTTCNAACETERSAAESALNNTLERGKTNDNDPYGATRNMTGGNGALTTVVSSTSAKGEKSVNMNFTTTFTLSCGATSTSSKVYIYVSDNNEG